MLWVYALLTSFILCTDAATYNDRFAKQRNSVGHRSPFHCSAKAIHAQRPNTMLRVSDKTRDLYWYSDLLNTYTSYL
jgi:hypothetical protein